MVSVLIPSNSHDYEAQLRRLTTCDPLPPFDPISIEFIDAVSKTVLRDPAMRSMPEMTGRIRKSSPSGMVTQVTPPGLPLAYWLSTDLTR